MVTTNVYLHVFCIIGMANCAVHFDLEATNYMKVGEEQPKLGRELNSEGMLCYLTCHVCITRVFVSRVLSQNWSKHIWLVTLM